jgi:hypothetical protein
MSYSFLGQPAAERATPVAAQDPDGQLQPLLVDADGALLVTADVTVDGADGALVDGVDPAIRATVKNYTNSKALAVISVDTNGDPTGGAAVSIANGADVALGATTDAKVVGDNAGTASAKFRGLNYLLALVVDTVNSRLDVFIRNTTIAVTQSGSWVLAAGTALVGKVGIDQTTPGTTNGVSIPALAVAATVTSVNDSASNQTLLSLNAARKGFMLFNDSTQIAYVKLGTTATTADYSFQLQPNEPYEFIGLGVYTGRIDCIWAADGSGAMKVTELA